MDSLSFHDFLCNLFKPFIFNPLFPVLAQLFHLEACPLFHVDAVTYWSKFGRHSLPLVFHFSDPASTQSLHDFPVLYYFCTYERPCHHLHE